MLLAIVTFAAAASMPVIDSIRIESRWGGLGEPSDKVYKIVRRNDRYVRRRTTVPADAVERLVAAIEAPPVERQSALRAIATAEWLAAVAHRPHEHAAAVPTCSDEAKHLFEQRLADPDYARDVLDGYFGMMRTDDYPEVKVDVALHDGRTLHIESHAQPALMLPWNVDGVKTWNPELPRAIAAMLPSGAEPRVSGEFLESDLVERVAMDLRHELDDIEERCIHRDLVTAVARAFEIVHVYHGSAGDFTAYVRRPDFPPNLVLTLVIRDAEKPGALAKLDRTVQRLPAYLDVVRGFLAAHPKTWFALWCVNGTSVDAEYPNLFDKNDAARLNRDADRAVELMEWDPASGIVSRERFILPGGDVLEEHP